jgi:Na+/proline symporter
MSCGAVVSAPAVVLSVVLGWDLTATALLITVPAVVYTMFGGVQAVTWTDVKIMVLIVGGLFAVIVTALLGLPADVSVTDGLGIAAATGRLRTFDFSFDLTNPYTFWSGTIAALFLFCSYFGTDQSQVQRYLTARSVDEARRSLLMSAYWKIPLQFLVLVLGVLVFVFYVFNPPPLLFSTVHLERMRSGGSAPAFAALESEFDAAYQERRAAAAQLAAARDSGEPGRFATATATLQRREAALQSVRTRAAGLVRENSDDRRFSDVNYIIPTFILTQLPVGLIGLLILAIIMAATDTIAGELNSLSTATVIDFYKRRMRPAASDAHYLKVSKIATGVWGLFACAVAIWAAALGSLIEVVNRFGSFFYGSILGVFILAVAFPRATGNGAFIGLCAGMASVAWAASFTSLAFLWHNVIGAVAVVIVGMLVSLIAPGAGGGSRLGADRSS